MSLVTDYLSKLEPNRREALTVIRQVILENLPQGYEEMFTFGMPTYVIPLSSYPTTYNEQPLQFAAFASHKNYMSLYLNCLYAQQGLLEDFKQKWLKTGHKLNMGKSCIRFTSLESMPLDLVGEVIAGTSVSKYIEVYELSRMQSSCN
ncbi:MAG: DUF1801 domain-containing protein [Mycobacteriaceae bacterium]